MLCTGQSLAETPANVRQEMRMDKPFVTDEQTQHETLPLVEASRDSLVRVTTKYVHTYIDTICVVRYSQDSVPRHDTTYVAADTTSRKGHYVQAYIGGGYGSIGFSLDKTYGGKVTGFFSGRAQVQYAYFFHPHWGIGAGLWFENLTSDASLANGKDYADFVYTERRDGDMPVTELNDDESYTYEEYRHTARIYKWRERATIYNLAVPVSIQTQWWKDNGEVGIFGALGIAPAFAITSKYELKEAVVEHMGYYSWSGLTLENIPEYGYVNNGDASNPEGYNPNLYTDKQNARGKMSVAPMATLFADLGVLVNLRKDLDLMVGVYGHFTPNNTVTDKIKSDYLPSGADEHAAPFGWAENQRVVPATFMDEYKGLYRTNLRTGKTYPWAVGLKVGIHWHHAPRPKRVVADSYDYFYRADTTVRTVERIETETVERIDTFKRAPKEEIKVIQKKVDKLNKIFFAFDSYTLNNKSKKYLKDIYAELREIPNHIIIGGHASDEGQAEYNELLALNRARAVMNYLIELGIPAEQMEVKNYGSRVANEDNAQKDLSLDRRVEIIIVE